MSGQADWPLPDIALGMFYGHLRTALCFGRVVMDASDPSIVLFTWSPDKGHCLRQALETVTVIEWVAGSSEACADAAMRIASTLKAMYRCHREQERAAEKKG